MHQSSSDRKNSKHYYPPGRSLVTFGSIPFLILIPPGTHQSQREFLRATIKAQADSMVETGLWARPLTDFDLDEMVRTAVIEY